MDKVNLSPNHHTHERALPPSDRQGAGVGFQFIYCTQKIVSTKSKTRKDFHLINRG
ncbi:hypothetical protein CsSME_00038359 [Camellia sinensis var. sinensis]